MTDLNFAKEGDFYLQQLLENILPFWLTFGRDAECGGYNTCLRRDGSVYEYDKTCTWGQGRIAWVFGHLYNNLRKDNEWLRMAMHGVNFMKQFGFDESGRVYYSLSREGVPLAYAKDVFADLSLIAGFAECAKATADVTLLNTARQSLSAIVDIVNRPETNPYRNYASARRPLSHNAEHMILLNTVQTLRELDDDPRYDQIAAACLEKILSLHYSEKHRAVFEVARADGHPLPGLMGRWICPGHMIELGWFMIHEGQHLKNAGIIRKGVTLIDWGMEWGWDPQYGGIVNDLDIGGDSLFALGVYWAPYKMWWAILEALYANLLAYSVTGQDKFLKHYRKVHDWGFGHFADTQHGDWYGHLDREGNVIDGQVKGTECKSCYHIARSFYFCHKLLQTKFGGRSKSA